MPCTRRERLEEFFNASIARFDRARKRLLERIAFSSSREFLALNNAVNRAVDWMDRARAALDLHNRQHSCVRQGGATAGEQPHVAPRVNWP